MKKLLTFMIVWTCLLTLAGCGKKDMDYTMQNESSVAESVRETGEESVLIQNEDAGEGEMRLLKLSISPLTYPELGRFIRREMQFHR